MSRAAGILQASQSIGHPTSLHMSEDRYWKQQQVLVLAVCAGSIHASKRSHSSDPQPRFRDMLSNLAIDDTPSLQDEVKTLTNRLRRSEKRAIYPR